MSKLFSNGNKKIILGVILIVVIIGGSFGVYSLYFAPESTEPEPTDTEPTEAEPTETEPTETEPTETEPTEPEPEVVTVVDATGASVNVTVPVERIITLNAGLTEMLCALGAEDLIVGRSETSNFPDSVLEIPVVGPSSSSPDMEVLLEMEPDLVFADTMLSRKPELLETMQNAGITVIIDQSSNITRIPLIIEYMGNILDNKEKATEIIEFINYYEDLVSERVGTLTESEKSSVYCEWASPIWQTYGVGTAGHADLVATGGVNIAANTEGAYPKLSAEYVVEENPDVILKMADYFSNLTQYTSIRNEIMNRVGLTETSAVTNNRVYVYDPVLFRAIRYPVGKLYWATWLHPDLFDDVNPTEVHEYLLEQFYGVSLEGIYSYPEFGYVEPEPSNVTIVDFTGNEITVPLPVNRIVSFASGITEIIYALDAGDKLVGRDYVSTFPNATSVVPIVQGSGGLNMELLAEVDPDLVIDDTNLDAETKAKIEETLGVPVIIDSPSESERIVPMVTNLGLILDAEETAAELVSFMNNVTDLVKSRLENLTTSEKPLVFYELRDWYSSNNTGVFHHLLADAGGINMAENETVMYPVLSPEFVVESNPDIIVKMVTSTNHEVTDFQAVRDEMMNRTELSGTTAVQEGTVYILDVFLRRGIRNPIGLLTFAKWFHPDLFADVDPVAIHEDLIQTFFGVDLEGIYGYPQA